MENESTTTNARKMMLDYAELTGLIGPVVSP